MRRLSSILAALALLAASAAHAADYPDKPIHLVVPFAAGGTTDVIARAVGQKLGTILGQQVIIENRPGANGNIGSYSVVKSAPDGYTLVLGVDGTMAINPALYSSLPFKPERDFAPISRVALVPLVLVANVSVRADTITDLVAFSKQSSNPLDFSSAGVGSAGHLAGEMIKQRTGARFSHVPYKGGGQAITDVVAGQVPLIITSLGTAGPFIKAGKLKAIGLTSATRFPGAPDMPTLAETGLKDFDVSSWYGLMAPAGTPDAILDRLHSALEQALADPELRAHLMEQGAQPVLDTRAQFAEILKTDTVRWAKIVKAAYVKIE